MSNLQYLFQDRNTRNCGAGWSDNKQQDSVCSEFVGPLESNRDYNCRSHDCNTYLSAGDYNLLEQADNRFLYDSIIQLDPVGTLYSLSAKVFNNTTRSKKLMNLGNEPFRTYNPRSSRNIPRARTSVPTDINSGGQSGSLSGDLSNADSYDAELLANSVSNGEQYYGAYHPENADVAGSAPHGSCRADGLPMADDQSRSDYPPIVNNSQIANDWNSDPHNMANHEFVYAGQARYQNLLNWAIFPRLRVRRKNRYRKVYSQG